MEQGDITVAQYEAKFTDLSRFAPQLIAIEEKKTLKFQDGLKPYLNNKIYILKLSVYSGVVDRALIAEKDNKELQQYREQQRKSSKSDGAHDNQEPKMFSSIESHIKGELVQNLDVTCSICGKKHWSKPCYKESEACFDCGKHGHIIRDCPENKKFIIGKPKKENKMDKQKPRVQGWMFATTHQDTQATSDVAIGTIQIYTLLLKP